MTGEPRLISSGRARAHEVRCEALFSFRHCLINREFVPS